MVVIAICLSYRLHTMWMDPSVMAWPFTRGVCVTFVGGTGVPFRANLQGCWGLTSPRLAALGDPLPQERVKSRPTSSPLFFGRGAVRPKAERGEVYLLNKFSNNFCDAHLHPRAALVALSPSVQPRFRRSISKEIAILKTVRTRPDIQKPWNFRLQQNPPLGFRTFKAIVSTNTQFDDTRNPRMIPHNCRIVRGSRFAETRLHPTLVDERGLRDLESCKH
jgi:hypothetical protein